MGNPFRLMTVAAAVAIVAVGCTNQEDEGGNPDPTASERAGQEAEAEENHEPSGRLQLAGWEDVQPQRGVSAALHAVEVTDAGDLLFEFEALNQGRGGVGLATRRGGVLALDDLGNVYPFVEPEDNDELDFETDHRMVGTLAFEGPIDENARRVTVAFNQREDDELVDGAEYGRGTSRPRLLIEDVPLPGVGLEEEADRASTGDLIDEVVVEVDETVRPSENEDVEFTLVQYVVRGQSVLVDVEIVNESTVPVHFTQGSPRLRDDQDTRFSYQRDEDADRDERILRLAPGEELSATLGWRGTLPEDVGSLEIEFNMNRGRDQRPNVQVDLPLPNDG